jgi:hypothetical protein
MKRRRSAPSETPLLRPLCINNVDRVRELYRRGYRPHQLTTHGGSTTLATDERPLQQNIIEPLAPENIFIAGASREEAR